MSSSLTYRFSELALTAHPPESVIELSRSGLIDYLGCAFAGIDNPAYQKVRAAFLPLAGQKGSFLLGQGIEVDPATAALLNGTLSHVLDFDDIHSDVRGHPSIVVLSALFAYLPNIPNVSAIQFLSAYCVGVEAMARLGRAMRHKHYETGFHATATLGPLGATVALGYLLNVTPNLLSNALGIAATQAAGLRAQFSTEVKPIHAGFAARSAISAILLTLAGIEGNRGILDSQFGFFKTLGMDDALPAVCLNGWGKEWTIESPGLIFKLYPCCGASYLPISAFLELRKNNNFSWDEIEKIIVTFPPGGDAALTVTKPETGRQGQFSIEYILAAFLVKKNVDLSLFKDGTIAPDISSVMSLISRKTDFQSPTLQEAPEKRFAKVTVIFKNSTSISHVSRSLPDVSKQDIKNKFFQNTHFILAKNADVWNDIYSMRSSEDLGLLLKLLK
ncbi:MmgE/PrpD family protein [Acetobacter cibinongensis]|uniref:MmgE/PrpD family protein n=1 Tax=Acetobacter cibinongensis TaxID=146475 RepID=UPI000A3646B7|nr:MmgE/PrpD family protein [Acetobacter cibinongensis]